MTHSADLLRLRSIEVDTLRDKVEELEGKLEVLQKQLEDYAKDT